MSDCKLTIAIPTWHNRAQLQVALNTLLAYAQFPYKVVVVDNGNDPALAANAESWPAHVEYFAPGVNRGWMGGINDALERCDTEFFAMMNDDVVFPANTQAFWRQLVEPFEDPEVGMTGPTSDFISGPQSIQHTLPMLHDTTYAIGVCLVLRTEFLRELGGLDESLPGGDDLDLAIRVRRAGKCIRIVRQAYLHHVGQQSGPRAQGAYYDSREHQDEVKNAIIRKHGLRWQVDTWSGMVSTPPVEGIGDHEWVRENIPEGAGLDVGCGDVILGENSVGVDIRSGVETGAGGQRNKVVQAGALVGNACSLPADSGSQDYLVACHVLEHIVSPIAALREWCRVLRPDGVALIVVPDYAKYDTRIIDHTHLHAFTRESLEDLTAVLPEFLSVQITEGPYHTLRMKAVRA